ncbi:hypothetical protein SLA2020_294620 [Shorea laevis]
MEDMDVDLYIPDTPDRLSGKKIVSREFSKNINNISVASHVGTSDATGEQCFDGQRGRNRLVRENSHHRKLRLPHNKRHCNGGMESQKGIIDLSSPENNPHGLKNVSLFRRSSVDKNFKRETRNSTIGGQHLDKGKAMCSNVPSKSFGSRKDDSILDLTEQNGHGQPVEMAFPCGRSRNLLAEERRNGDSVLHTTLNASGISSNTRKGKEKIDDNRYRRVGSVVGHGEGIDDLSVSHEIETKTSASNHSVVLPRVTGKKRLVRNGCISPENIVIRAKQLGDHLQNYSKDVEVERNHVGDVVSNSRSTINIADIVGEENYYCNGKGLAINPHISTEHDINIINLSSSPMGCIEEASRTNDSHRDGGFEGKGGWRSTCNHLKNTDPAAGHHFRGLNGSGSQINQHNKNRMVKNDDVSGENSSIAFGRDGLESQGAPQAASTSVSKPNHTSEPSKAKNMLHTRQRKREPTLRNLGKASRVVSDDSNIICLGSSAESSSRSSRIHNEQFQNNLDPDESYGVRQTDSHNDLEDRARQVEADEMLARELQEQLYHEVPTLGNGEIDENIAWALQQQEEAIGTTATFQNHYVPNPRSTRHTLRQPQLRSSQSSSARRRGGQPRQPTHRMSRLANRFPNQSRAASSRARNFQFPLGMDLDTRLDILEALEAAAGDHSDIGPVSGILHAQRDFNENDYEMLLALDENDHQHGGASVHQINNLPQSVVQTDNFEEACAICLETPAVGDTIRHLPCLHKFHKDCIDPWLSRKTSCPVCKLSIT